MKFTLIFLISSSTLSLFFYFYPAHIFESKISGNGTEVVMDLSLKSVFFKQNLPENLNPENITSIKLTTSGFMILIVCLAGLPLMIAYRFSMKKKEVEENSTHEKNKS